MSTNMHLGHTIPLCSEVRTYVRTDVAIRLFIRIVKTGCYVPGNRFKKECGQATPPRTYSTV